MPNFDEQLESIRDTTFIGEEAAWNGLQALEKGEIEGEAADAMRGHLQVYKTAMKERGNRYVFPTYEAKLADDETNHFREVFGGPERLRAIVGPDEVKVAEQDAGTSGRTPDDVMMGNAAFGYLLDRTGIDEATLGENLPSIMADYGSRVLGVEGIDSPTKFYGAMQTHYEGVEKQTAFAGRISQMAQEAAANMPDSKAGPMGTKGMSFDGLVNSWAAITADPDFDSKNAALYKETFRQKYEAMNQVLAKADPVAEKVLGMLDNLAKSSQVEGEAGGKFVLDTQEGVLGMLGAIGDVMKDGGGLEDIDRVKFLIAKRMQDQSKEQGTGDGMERSVYRGIDDILINLGTNAFAGPATRTLQDLEDGKELWVTKLDGGGTMREKMMAYAMGGGMENAGGVADRVIGRAAVAVGGLGMARKLTEEERAELRSIVEPISKAADMVQFLKQARESTDPIKPGNDWIPDKVETALFDASRSIPYTGLAVLPASIGLTIASTSMAEDSYREIMANDPTANRQSARLASDISGMAQAVTERFVDQAVLFNKLPFVGKALSKLKIENGFARFGASVLTKAGMEFSEEKLQDLEDAAARDLVSAMSKDMQGTDWGREYTEFTDAGGNLRTFLAVLPLSIVGAGAGSLADIKDGARISKDVSALKATGFDEKTAQTIAAEADMTKRESMIRDAWKERKVSKLVSRFDLAPVEAAAIVDETDRGKRRQMVGDIQEERQRREGEALPVGDEVRRDGLAEIQETDLLFERARAEGVFPAITRIDEGYRVTFPEIEGTKPIDVPTLDDATQTVDNWMEATNERENLATTEWAQWLELFHVEQRFDDKRDVEMTAGMKVGNDPVMLAQLQQRAALEGVSYNDRLRIFGESERVMVGKRAEYVTRLYKGGNPFDVAEEFAEGFIKGSFDTGDHTVEEVLGMLRQYEAASGTTVVKSVSTQGVIESFSDMARGYIAGNIRSEMVPATMRGWFNSMVHFLRDAFAVTGQLLKFKADLDRSEKLQETKAAGNLDPNFEQLLKKATGLDIAGFERRTMEDGADMDGMNDPDSEISAVVKGKLPRPSDVANLPAPNFRGELEMIWDAMSKETRARRKDGRKRLSGAKANAFFAPPGQGMPLDDLRQFANERGFNFETPDEMLVAINDSVNGFEQFGTMTQFNEGELESSQSIGLNEDGGGVEESKPGRKYEIVNEANGYWSGVMKERRVFQRMEAGHVVELAPAEEMALLKNKYYETMPKGVTLDAAKKAIANAGTLENAVLAFMDDSNAIHPRVKVLMGGILRSMALDRKTDAGYQLAAGITDRLAEVATQGGQVIEAFKYLGSGFATTEGALAWVKRQVKKAREATLPKEQVDNTRQAVVDVMKEANKLFNGWLNEALGIKDTKKRKEAIDVYRVEDIPDVTFSLNSSLEALVPWAVETMRELGADAIDTLLVKKYGDRIKPHLADVKVEAMKRLSKPRKPHKPKEPKRANPEPRPETESRPTGEPVPFEDRSQADLGLPADPKNEPARPRDGVTPEQQAAWNEGKLTLDLADFRDELVQRVFDKLKVRNIETPRQAREGIDAVFKQIVGAKATPEQTAQIIEDVFATKFKAPTMTAAMVKGTEEFSQRIARTPEGSVARRQATLEFMNFVHDSLNGVDWLDVAWSVWYANVLSGYNTHIKNVGDSGLQVMADTLLASLSGSPKNWFENMQQAIVGLKEGYATGAAESKRHIQTGEALVARDAESKFGAGNILERTEIIGGKINPFNWLKYVPRLLVAEDYLQYAGAMEAKARLVALEMARLDKTEGETISSKVEMILNKSPERIAEHRERAVEEWAGMQPGDYSGTKGEWIERRTKELGIMERDGDLLERSADFAARATYNYKPEGHIGAFAELIGIAVAGMQRQAKPGDGVGMKIYSAASSAPRLLMPFVRIVANVMNKQLDYTPAGLIRSMMAETIERQGTQKIRKVKSVDQRSAELKKGIIGTALLVGLLLRTPDDEDNLFEIHGAGPTDFNKANQLRATGWIPNSIQVGDRFISYKNTPLAMLFSVIGNAYDAERFEEGRDQETTLMKFAFGMTDAAQVILDQSFLSNMSDFFAILGRKGEATTSALNRFLQRTINPAQAVPFANLLRQANADFDSKLRDKKGIAADMASMVPVTSRSNKPKLDALGDDIDSRVAGWLWSAEASGGIEPRIWKMVVDKKAWFTNTWQYSSKMEPDQYYQYQQERGREIKAKLIENDGRLLRAMEGMTPERAQERMQKLCTAASKKARKIVKYVDPDDAKAKAK